MMPSGSLSFIILDVVEDFFAVAFAGNFLRTLSSVPLDTVDIQGVEAIQVAINFPAGQVVFRVAEFGSLKFLLFELAGEDGDFWLGTYLAGFARR